MSVEKVLAAMQSAGKPMRVGEIAEAAGIEKKEADKAMKILKAEGKIVSPKRCFWEAE